MPSTDKQYKVTTTIEGSETVTVQWYTGDSLGLAISAMAQAAAQDDEPHRQSIPESVRYRTREVHLTIEHPEPGATPSTEGPGYRIVGGMEPRFEPREAHLTTEHPEPDLLCSLCIHLGLGHDGDHIVPGD